MYRSSAQGGDESSEDDVSTMLDEVHLALLKGVAGPAPPQVMTYYVMQWSDALDAPS